MATDVVVPELGESITEATILKWYKQAGEAVAADETLVELETEKITVEVPAPEAGVVAEISADAGTDVAVGQKICVIDAASNTGSKTGSKKSATQSKPLPADSMAATKDAPKGSVKEAPMQDVLVPELGESITEASVMKWLKSVGEAVSLDETLVELETDKVSVEVPAPIAGTLAEILVQNGSDVQVGGLLCRISPAGIAGVVADTAKAAPKPVPETKAAPAPHLSPAVAKGVADNNLDASKITASGPKGNIVKADVMKAATQSQTPVQSGVTVVPPESQLFAPAPERQVDVRGEERVKMSRLRKAIAGRLKSAQNTAALLTTFNEIDMGALIDLRKEYKESFEKNIK